MESIDLIGRLVKPVEYKELPHGEVADLRLACSRGQSDKNGNTYADYHNVSLWGRNAQVAQQYTAVGSLVSIIGQLENHNYKSNGKNYQREYIFGRRIELLETKQQTLAHKAAAKDQHTSVSTNDYNKDQSHARTARDQPISNTDDSDSFPF